MDLKTQDDTEVLFNQQGESGVLDAAGGGGRLSESGCWVMLSWAWGERQACCSLQRGRNLLPIFVAPPLPEGRRSYMILICNSSFKNLPPLKKKESFFQKIWPQGKSRTRKTFMLGALTLPMKICMWLWIQKCSFNASFTSFHLEPGEEGRSDVGGGRRRDEWKSRGKRESKESVVSGTR